MEKNYKPYLENAFGAIYDNKRQESKKPAGRLTQIHICLWLKSFKLGIFQNGQYFEFILQKDEGENIIILKFPLRTVIYFLFT